MSNISAKARIAVVGAGLIGKRHAEHVAKHAVLASIVDPAAEAAKIAQRFSVPQFASLEDLFAAQQPDGIIIATPNQLHLAHGLAAIAKGIPTLVEKPIADTSAAGQALVEAAQNAGVPLMVGHHRRYNPLIAKAKTVIESGRLGQLVTAHTTTWFHKPANYFEVPWRRQHGAGPILVNLIHDVDLLRHLCGDVVAVQAQSSNAVRRNPVEETAVILLRFASGVLGTVTVSDIVSAPWSWEFTSRENPAYPHFEASNTMLGGTNGSLSLPDLGVWSHSPAPSWWNPMDRTQIEWQAEDPLALQIRHFSEVALGRAEPLVTGAEGLATLRVIEAIHEASETGDLVTIVSDQG